MSGVPITIPGLPALATPATADVFAIWDTDTGLTTKMTISQLNTFFAALAGPGTQIFSVNLTIDRATPQITLQGSGQGALVIADMDNGAANGNLISIGRNNNASTPAGGVIRARDIGNVFRTLWCDGAGNWRTATVLPTSVNDTGGTVVGTQTSSLDTKDVQGDPIAGAEALAWIVAAAEEAVKRFTYKGQSGISQEVDPITGEMTEVPWTSPPPYEGVEFSGIIVDYAPRYGMDIDAAHPAGKSLNTINATGDSFLAIAELARRIGELETRLQTAVDGVEAALANFETQQGGT